MTDTNIDELIELLENMLFDYNQVVTINRTISTLKSQAREIEMLQEGLEQVRLDICECGVVVFRLGGVGTTFDCIGQALGDNVTWEEWEARQALKSKETP